MKRLGKIILLIIIALPAVVSCRVFTSVNDDKVVAKVGKHRLTLNEIRQFIPENTTPEDSIKIAMQYINVWAAEWAFADVAERQLSKQEKDVDKELEEYRMALLRYRYEQRYINERLDTALTDDEINEYYESRRSEFVAETPVVKARFMRISADSPNLELIKRKMSSERPWDIMEADSLAYSSADIYTDYDGKWIDLVELARDLGVDYSDIFYARRKSLFSFRDVYGKVNVAYISDYVPIGSALPIEYCEDEIKDILIGTRKHKLVMTLEQDLLDDARDRGKFIIY